ncbi:MAG: endolytic transglycosylase MltG, partial [bacterium]
ILERSKINDSNFNEIITMASIIEGEAMKDEDRKIIADILWRRIDIGMMLQVDTTFMYINGKASSEITKADLKINSPYNTYTHKGLPPTPISNPGIEAINSAMFPTANKYLYYLSDKDGVMHYAVTFAEHKKNKEKYLR